MPGTHTANRSLGTVKQCLGSYLSTPLKSGIGEDGGDRRDGKRFRRVKC